ncbi:envelope glycoprotein H, partial [Striga asiatica]
MSQNNCDGREQAKGLLGFRVQQQRPHGMKLPPPHAQMNTSSRMGLQPVQQPRPHGMKIPPPPAAQMNSSSRMSRGRWKNRQRSQRKDQSQTIWASTELKRNQNSWASPEPRMHAIFLGSGPKSSGTGVFIPQTHVAIRQFNKRPAFSPVLLPARVVQALNLNVH